MKTDYEMYQSVLSKRSEYRNKRERKLRIIKRTIPVFACFCLIVGLGLGYWRHIGKMQIIPPDPDTFDVTLPTVTETTEAAVTESTSAVKTVTTTAKTHTNTDSRSVKTIHVTAQPYTTDIAHVTYTTAAARHQVTTKATQVSDIGTVKQTTVTNGQTTAAFTSTTTKFGSFGGDDMAIHTLPQSGTTVSATTLITSTTAVTTTTNIIDNNIPTQLMNEKFPLGIFDGDMTLYRNTYRISPDNVDNFIGTVGVRGQLSIYYANAFKIKGIDETVAIAVKFEEDEGYYLYRNNNTTVDTIKELISPEE